MQETATLTKPRSFENPTWSLWQALSVGVASFLSAIVAFAVLSTSGMRLYFAVGFSTPQARAATIVLAYAVAACVGYLVAKLQRKRDHNGLWASIEWNYSNRGAAIAVLGGLCAAVLMRFALTGHVAVEVNPSSGMSALFALVLLGTVVVEPLVEEVYFRGILFSGLARAVGSVVSMGLVTAAFVLLHVQHRWIVLPVSLVLAVVRLRTKSTANCFALHAAYNFGIVLWGIR